MSETPPAPAPPPPNRVRPWVFLLAALALVWAAQVLFVRKNAPRKIRYDELWTLVEAGRVKEASIGDDEVIALVTPEKEGAPEENVVAERIPAIEERPLVDALRARNAKILGRVTREGLLPRLASALLPFLLIGAFFWWSSRKVAQAGGRSLSFGKSRAKIVDRSAVERVTFEDVAGVNEAKAELAEVVSFLKEPEKYRKLGARMPKGVLLVGPPGTGKTLLARAVAGEASVPFFSLSGSEFVEMFVGVGAARMRDLFEQAKTRAPCIVFIDELDAIGKSRGGVGAMATHDEREQTLNQLLVEMDGFDPGQGVIIMAATNRPEVLDKALVRAGRFDRQVLVDRPGLAGRRAILALHARKTKLAGDVDLDLVARRTPGMVGADLANVVNEAALCAGRREAREISQRDFEEAIDRLQLGLKQRGRVMTPEEKRRVAYHEAGHALVALSVEHTDPVHRVTIIPRSIGALGATLQLPTEERFLMTRVELDDRLAVMLGGRAAEEVVCGDVSTGAQNDLERATETARQMVCRFGMSEKLGVPTWGRPAGARFLEAPVAFEDRNFSEETARAIDAEVRAIVEGARARAVRILEERRATLEAIAARLIEEETLSREDLATLAPARPSREGVS